MSVIERCIHQDVCEFKQEGPEGVCGLRKICKHYPEDDEDVSSKPTKKKVRIDEDGNEPKISEAVFKRAKKKLDNIRDTGNLDENQVKAMDEVKGKHFKTLTEPQKAQIVEMADSIKV
jgi:hypothetical protein